MKINEFYLFRNKKKHRNYLRCTISKNGDIFYFVTSIHIKEVTDMLKIKDKINMINYIASNYSHMSVNCYESKELLNFFSRNNEDLEIITSQETQFIRNKNLDKYHKIKTGYTP